MAANDRNSAPAALPVLHLTENQVAGHGFDAAALGSSVDDSGRFYKPLQDDERGDREVDFYKRLQSDEGLPTCIRGFFAKFFGTIAIDAPKSDKAVRHAILEDVTHGFLHPSIIDLKIGARTWYEEATEHTITKNKVKDKETTSGALGFRVSGMQVYEASSGTAFKAHRDWTRNLTADEVPVTLKRYVSSNPHDETAPDAAFAASVYGGPDGVIAQLKVLDGWFCTQTFYHFASASLLIIYEGGVTSTAENDGKLHNQESSHPVIVKLIDFAHTIPGKSSLDENFLVGLRSVISLLSDILELRSAK